MEIHAYMAFSAQTCNTTLQSTAFACTECFRPRNIDDCTMVKDKYSNNLKNFYESEKINSQDSEQEDKKSVNQYSEYEDEEETYAQYNET